MKSKSVVNNGRFELSENSMIRLIRGKRRADLNGGKIQAADA